MLLYLWLFTAIVFCRQDPLFPSAFLLSCLVQLFGFPLVLSINLLYQFYCLFHQCICFYEQWSKVCSCDVLGCTGCQPTRYSGLQVPSTTFIASRPVAAPVFVDAACKVAGAVHLPTTFANEHITDSAVVVPAVVAPLSVGVSGSVGSPAVVVPAVGDVFGPVGVVARSFGGDVDAVGVSVARSGVCFGFVDGDAAVVEDPVARFGGVGDDDDDIDLLCKCLPSW